MRCEKGRIVDTDDTKNDWKRHRHDTEGIYSSVIGSNSWRGESDAQDQIFAIAAAALILAGIGSWASATVNAGRAAAAIPINVQMDAFQEMEGKGFADVAL